MRNGIDLEMGCLEKRTEELNEALETVNGLMLLSEEDETEEAVFKETQKQIAATMKRIVPLHHV